VITRKKKKKGLRATKKEKEREVNKSISHKELKNKKI